MNRLIRSVFIRNARSFKSHETMNLRAVGIYRRRTGLVLLSKLLRIMQADSESPVMEVSNAMPKKKRNVPNAIYVHEHDLRPTIDRLGTCLTVVFQTAWFALQPFKNGSI